jgi:hypothetical protein
MNDATQPDIAPLGAFLDAGGDPRAIVGDSAFNMLLEAVYLLRVERPTDEQRLREAAHNREHAAEVLSPDYEMLGPQEDGRVPWEGVPRKFATYLWWHADLLENPRLCVRVRDLATVAEWSAWQAQL